MGSLQVWLKEGVETGNIKPEMKGDCRIETKRATGQQYLYLDNDLLDPTVSLPDVPSEMIDRVTYRDSINEGFRTSGVYHHQGAKLTVKSDFVTAEMTTHYQIIGIKGPNVAVVKDAFSLFRQGKIFPDENWEAPQVTRKKPASLWERLRSIWRRYDLI